MKKSVHLIIAIIFSMIVSEEANAQFSISGEIRPRFEIRNGYKKMPQKGTTAAWQVSQRTRLNFVYGNNWLKTRISLQDVRIWGDESMKKDVAGAALYEAWVDINITDSLSVCVGRQELSWDNERLLGKIGWSQKGLTHDALLLKYKHSGWTIDFAASFNQSRDTTFSTDYNTGLGNYKTLNYLILGKRFGKFGFNLAGFADSYQLKGTTNTNYLRATYGGSISFRNKLVNATARGFYQSGQNENGMFINAWYAGADLKINVVKPLVIWLGGEYQSGNDGTDATNSQARYFTCLYGTAHAFNGNLDYFTKPADTKFSGLSDIYLNFIVTLTEKISTRLDFHYFMTSNKFVNNNEVQNAGLGSEADWWIKFDFTKEVALQLGYSTFLGTETMELVNGGSKDKFPSWGWVMLTVKPVFFKYEKS